MIIINGHKFYEEPGSCGTCPFLLTGNTNTPIIGNSQTSRGICIQWNETHHTWASIPRRCAKLFKKAFEAGYPDGTVLAIVSKNQENENSEM